MDREDGDPVQGRGQSNPTGRKRATERGKEEAAACPTSRRSRQIPGGMEEQEPEIDKSAASAEDSGDSKRGLGGVRLGRRREHSLPTGQDQYCRGRREDGAEKQEWGQVVADAIMSLEVWWCVLSSGEEDPLSEERDNWPVGTTLKLRASTPARLNAGGKGRRWKWTERMGEVINIREQGKRDP